jgi:uridine phosphorylase
MSEGGGYRDEVRFTPAMYLDHVLRERASRGLPARLEDFSLAPLVIGTWFQSVTEHLAKEAGLSPSENWPYGSPATPQLFTGQVGGINVSLTTFPVGAPGTVAILEELVAAGARRIIGLGMAGSLQETAPVGAFLLPGECVREEGTSLHYLPAETMVGPDPALREALSRALAAAAPGRVIHSGRHWTTDAIYREFIWKIEKYRAAGVLGVDMETSAMYALGQFLGLPVANLLVVSDELWHRWRPGFGTSELRKAMRQAGGAILAGLPELAQAGRVTYSAPE